VSQPRIAAFAGTANGNAQPLRTISGQATLQGRTNHQMAFDSTHDEIVVPNPFAQAILFFRGGANGEEPPVRVIQGPKTELNYTDNVTVDEVNGEVVTAQRRTNSIFVYNRLPAGDEAPVRILHGPKTRLDRPYRVAVDAVNNLLAVTTSEGILIFNRTDNGDVAPKWVIAGPKADIHQSDIIRTPIFYPEGKKIFVAGSPVKGERGVVLGVWNYGDNGDVAPWAVIANSATTKAKKSNGGMAIDPEAREVMLLGGVNAGTESILVFHVPELFGD
jgi:hypothetical protein